MQKKYLELFYKTLSNTEPKLADARLRDMLLKQLGESADAYIKDRQKIYVTFCDKKEDGTPDIKNDRYSFKPELLEEINKELTTLLEEEVDLKIDPKIKEILKGTNYGFKHGEVELFDELVTKL